MKKILLPCLPDGMPQEFLPFAADAPIYDSSSSPEANVYFIDKGHGYYLKRSGKGMLEKESKMTGYFHAKALGPEALQYITAEQDWLLTAAADGEDCLHERYLADPRRLCDTLALELRRLHETDFIGCPVQERTAEYLAFAEKNYRAGTYDSSHFPDSFGYSSAQEAYDVLTTGKTALQSRVLLHGDYCLPNVILKNWALSGFIDVGCGGVGDRHIDLFWGVWSLEFNLKTDRYRARFLDAYGRDKVDEALLKVIAAAEVFG